MTNQSHYICLFIYSINYLIGVCVKILQEYVAFYDGAQAALSLHGGRQSNCNQSSYNNILIINNIIALENCAYCAEIRFRFNSMHVYV